MRLSVYFTHVNCRLIQYVRWVQIFKSKSNFPSVQIILNAEIELSNSDAAPLCHHTLYYYYYYIVLNYTVPRCKHVTLKVN